MPTYSPNQYVRLTRTVIEATPTPGHGQVFLRDATLRGFGLRIASGGTRCFIAEKRIAGRNRRISIGRYPDLTVEQARKQAYLVLGQAALGIDPSRERQRQYMKGLILAQVFADFRRTRKGIKERTLYDYERVLQVALPDWRERPLKAITKDMVVALTCPGSSDQP